MLVGIVFLFLVGELPTHLASRRSAMSLLYGGDLSKVYDSFMEKWVGFNQKFIIAQKIVQFSIHKLKQ